MSRKILAIAVTGILSAGILAGCSLPVHNVSQLRDAITNIAETLEEKGTNSNITQQPEETMLPDLVEVSDKTEIADGIPQGAIREEGSSIFVDLKYMEYWAIKNSKFDFLTKFKTANDRIYYIEYQPGRASDTQSYYTYKIVHYELDESDPALIDIYEYKVVDVYDENGKLIEIFHPNGETDENTSPEMIVGKVDLDELGYYDYDQTDVYDNPFDLGWDFSEGIEIPESEDAEEFGISVSDWEMYIEISPDTAKLLPKETVSLNEDGQYQLSVDKLQEIAREKSGKDGSNVYYVTDTSGINYKIGFENGIKIFEEYEQKTNLNNLR